MSGVHHTGPLGVREVGGALKVLPAGIAATADRPERFRREAKALAALRSHFLTMQLVEGQGIAIAMQQHSAT